MTKRFNVAVVGCNIGRSHIVEGYEPHGDKYRVLAVCDLDETRLSSVAEEFDVPRRCRDFDQLLAMDDVDIIDISTPPATHRPMVLKALAAGKHVVCEKPLVGSLAEVDEIIAAEAKAKGRLMPIFQYRYGDGAMQTRRIIDSGLAGKPYVGTCETLWKRGPDYYDNPWRGRWATELGGVLMTHAIHIHDLMTFLMGPVERLFARTATRVNAIEVEDCVSSSWLMASGALVSATATLGSHEEISRLRLSFENVTFESTHAPYSPGDGPWRIIPANEVVGRQIDELLAGFPAVGRRFNGQMEAFHRALLAGDPPPVTSLDARRALELVTAFYHSDATGEDVALPLDAAHPKYLSWRPAA
ncbi:MULTISPECIES: Gfo/Idh/MocA family protein [Chelatococcus]|uniref:Putative dehydrogenase n=1 Tax=Chelatococcus caeni TaxID=1348468 RepID=A0A840C449_9HYPH|nr:MULTISPECIES: Gfo/Idh/MocA family oxidoreductase [Chelatococcus]ALA17073.1 oxidoreductase [Chelatococcus sp. CO-6]MBB4017187.1 putative dehydrogenase [Chelatococcus caeni]